MIYAEHLLSFREYGILVHALTKLKDACSLSMTNLGSVLKSRDITLPTKVCIVKTMPFPVVTYRCKSWTIKKAEHWRIDAFELWCWRRFLRVPWTTRSSNQSILKEINPEQSLEGLMLKLQYFGHFGKEPTHSKNPDVGKDWRQEEKGTIDAKMVGWHHQLDGHEFEQTLRDSEGQRSLVCCSPWIHKESDTTELVNNKKAESTKATNLQWNPGHWVSNKFFWYTFHMCCHNLLLGELSMSWVTRKVKKSRKLGPGFLQTSSRVPFPFADFAFLSLYLSYQYDHMLNPVSLLRKSINLEMVMGIKRQQVSYHLQMFGNFPDQFIFCY